MRALGSGNKELAGTSATFALVGATGSEIPLRWNDTAGPWWDDVRLARGYFGGALKGCRRLGRIRRARQASETGAARRYRCRAAAGGDPRVRDGSAVVLPSRHRRSVGAGSRARPETTAPNRATTSMASSFRSATPKHALLKPNGEYRVVVHYYGGARPEAGRAGRGTGPERNRVAAYSQQHVTWALGPPSRTFFTGRRGAAQSRSMDPGGVPAVG